MKCQWTKLRKKPSKTPNVFYKGIEKTVFNTVIGIASAIFSFIPNCAQSGWAVTLNTYEVKRFLQKKDIEKGQGSSSALT